jgi:nitrate/TMAO reductase-like tetraheme cytochrome c subunit
MKQKEQRKRKEERKKKMENRANNCDSCHAGWLIKPAK